MKRKYGLLKPLPDIHTLGINTIKSLLLECHESVSIADEALFSAIKEEGIHSTQLSHWIIDKGITHLGLSYRLDPIDALGAVDTLIAYLNTHQLFSQNSGPIQKLVFAGLPESCDLISARYGTQVGVFSGFDSLFETMKAMDVPPEKIPVHLIQGNRYDVQRTALAQTFIQSKSYETMAVPKRLSYPEFGTKQDRLDLRLSFRDPKLNLPLTRVHVGPYDHDRLKAVAEFEVWCASLAKSAYLDICSIGSSQLTQSHFEKDWTGLSNGGGVPIQNAQEYQRIYDCSRPMLMRTYSGTSDVDKLVKVHEDTLNIAWHALSLWWFNQLDGRGPNDLLTNLHQHTQALKAIAAYQTPFEPNVPHHFAFRGADDLTYVISAVLAARAAKHYGIKEFVLQVMLNTPRATWGITDLAKARSILKLIEPLIDENFKLYLQPRAGLDYFSPVISQAKVQLASVTMLMDDIQPQNENSPDIIHVVSFSEAVSLATPDIINESIKITLSALQAYREHKKTNPFLDQFEVDIQTRTEHFVTEGKKILDVIETKVKDPYSPVGLASIFEAGFLPTPSLWGNIDHYPHATHFSSRFKKGSTVLTNHKGQTVSTAARITYALKHLPSVEKKLEKTYQKLQKNLEKPSLEIDI